MSMTACKQEGTPSSVPSQGDGSSVAASPIDVPDLPENKMLVTSPGESDFLIAENGTAKTTIVIPADPSDKVRTAAEDLQSHLNDITGTVIKIGYDNVDRTEGNYILVGPTKQTAAMGIEQPTGYPENERVILKRDKNYVAILGNDDGNFRGTEMAVTMFLEKLGCGWFGTDYLWQVIPEYPTLAVGELDINHTPQFSARGTRIGSQHAKLNIRWYQGGMQVMTGHGLPGMIPIDTYYPSHPEWFALVDGSRDPKTQKWWQYDYSNKELAAEVAKKMIDYFENNPNMMSYPVTSNDGWEESWCECEDCAALGNPTDQLLYFANNVAEIVSKKFPDRTLSILSYHNNYFPPEKVKAHPNVEIMFCREASMTTPLDLNEPSPGWTTSRSMSRRPNPSTFPSGNGTALRRRMPPGKASPGYRGMSRPATRRFGNRTVSSMSTTIRALWPVIGRRRTASRCVGRSGMWLLKGCGTEVSPASRFSMRPARSSTVPRPM